MTLKLLLSADFLESSGPTCMMAINLILPLFPGEDHLFRIDYDNVISDIEERRIYRLVLPHKQSRCLRSQSSDGLAAGIYYEPFAILLKVFPARDICLHDKNLQF